MDEMLRAVFAPALRWFREFLGLCVLCAGGGGALTALALMPLNFLTLIVVVVGVGVLLLGMGMSTPRRRPGESLSQRVLATSAMRRYNGED